MAEKRAFVLDVDGTFLKTDMLYETFWAGLGQAPLQVIGLLFRHFRNPAALKSKLAGIVDLAVERLPVNAEVAEMARAAKASGHVVAFASASDQAQVQRLAEHHAITDKIFASDGKTNLKGATKAAVLVQAFGEGGFDYTGDAAADRAVWDKSGVAVVVGKISTAAALEVAGRQVVTVDGGWRASDLMRALRPHQWVKNALLLVPLIAAHAFDLTTLMSVLIGIAAFSAAASCIYIVNDLLDLDADRLHPTKCNRPFASGAVPIGVGMVSSLMLAVLALALGSILGWGFSGVVVAYIALLLAYSLKLKRMRWIDIATLASLYSLRVVAGALAGGLSPSEYLLAFIFPVFVTLACVKRLTELTLATSDERLPGRGYGRLDRQDLLNVAALGTLAALFSFFFYSFSEQAYALYATQWLLWLALIPISGWLIRMVLLGYAGKQDYDPIIFAMRDRFGIGLILITISLMLYSAGLWAEWFGG